MAKYALSVVLSCFLFVVHAQEQTAEFGEITLNDFNVTRFDSTSSAVVLFDKGTFGGLYPPFLERHIRVKILNSEAFNTWGDFYLGNYFQTTSRISAATHYVEDGKVVSHIVEKDAIYNAVKENKKQVNLPNLRKGCIIELKYRSTWNHFSIPSWFIQNESPVLWSEYNLVSRANLTYVIHGGYEPFIYDPKYKGQFHRWVFKDIPAFRHEALMPHPVNYFARVEFWDRSASWEEVNKDYISAYKQWLGKFEHLILKRKLRMQIDSVADPLEKVKFLCTYIKRNYKWSERYDFYPSYYSTFFEDRKGDSGELNILLYSLLQYANIQSELVLLSTEQYGRIIKHIPSLSQFNYAVCTATINGKQYWLDTTDPRLPFDVMPSHCIDTDGFVINKGGGYWTKIEPVIMEKINANAWLSIADDQTFRGSVRFTIQGYGAFKQRDQYTAIGELAYKQQTTPNHLWNMDSARVYNVANRDLPLVITHFGSLPGYITKARDRMYINPYIVFAEEKNALLGTTREYPIQFDSRIEKTMIFNVTVPEGYQVESLPKSQNISLSDKSITCSFRLVNDEKSIMVIYKMHHQRKWFEREEYGNLQEFFNQIISKQKEMIVLKKTES